MNNRNTRKRSEIISKLKIKTPEPHPSSSCKFQKWIQILYSHEKDDASGDKVVPLSIKPLSIKEIYTA